MRPPRKVKRKSGGHVWEVRYREGGRHRSKVFDRKADAENFEAEVRRRKQLGTISYLHAGDDLLADFAVEWRRLHAKPNLEPSTLSHYSQVWDRHVLPSLDGYRLKELTPEVVSEFRATLAGQGRRRCDDPQGHVHSPVGHGLGRPSRPDRDKLG